MTELFPVVPNPTHGSSLVRYAIARPGPVHVAIYSVDGRIVKTLANGTQEAGRYEFNWDGRDARGSMVKSGAFFVRLEAEGQRKSRTFSVIR